MKLVANIASESIQTTEKYEYVHQISVIGGWRKLDEPTRASEVKCLICNGNEHYITFGMGKDDGMVWLCGNGLCAVNDRKNRITATTVQPIQKRAVLWPLFCEMNDIGKSKHDVCFEKIEQSAGKLDYLKKFVTNPTGIIIMRGDPGTGKTYASLGVCEYLTRTETSVVFIKYKQLMDKWLDMFKPDKVSNLTKKLKECTLLVVDDFATSDPSPGFMTFFMDIIDARVDEEKRGTIITTNLDHEKLNKFCGEALADRIMRGQVLQFIGETRRKEIII